MKISLIRPSTTQASWAVLDNGGAIEIEPYFRNRSCTQTIAHVEFRSESGLVVPGTLVVQAKLQPRLVFRGFDATKLVSCPFDQGMSYEDQAVSAEDQTLDSGS